ncbi:hypothetical protein M422DRAFT_34895 [Sphaerobolus stellatus SS14]|uniref:HAT C-terminal dimerisation domain-containing protein n=1 Tax=Sphaerobolus stellatus (strain SS14) TaxID=990650 RepID=A0A0C9VCF7_SPHS4|nr:hypothetical protein M422DRAFT_34895 [Sphaerobolus stellatus SS14]
MESTHAYTIAMILTPYVKMLYLEEWWNDTAPLDPMKTLADQARESFLKRFETSYSRRIESTIFGKIHARPTQIQSESLRYLSEDATLHPENGGPDVLEYWKSVQHVYPQLSKMAMDYLTIQGSATPVEYTKKCNRLGAERLAALQFLKNIYRKRRVRKMTSDEKRELREERLRQINMADWRNDTVGTRNMKFIDIELDFV